jgi:HSP20 family molecular chaperone IbpA
MTSECTTATCEAPVETDALATNFADRWIRPVSDILENADEYRIVLEMPGVSSEQIDLQVENRQLSVRGRRSFNRSDEFELIHAEQRPASYWRNFVLSDDVDAGKIGAECTNGVVTIRLPKLLERKPRKITVRTI